MTAKVRHITNCRACGSDKLEPYLSMPDSPPANRLVDSPDAISEKFEVKVLLCTDCFLSQLSVVVNPSDLYSDYTYHSAISRTWRDHCRDLARTILEDFEFKREIPNLLDIASNDGCLLEEFKEEGFIVAGFEPCEKMARECNSRGLHTVNAFFDRPNAARCGEYQMDVITATNVLAHVDDLEGFIEGVKFFLEPKKGIFVIEVPHMLKLLDFNQFDTVYHEHLSYFLLGPMIGLFKKLGLDIFRVDRLDIHGGSIRVYACVEGTRQIDTSVYSCIYDEKQGKMYTVEIYHEFAGWIKRLGDDMRTVLGFCRSTEKKVMGYGASAKGISLINYLGVGKLIHSIVDETPYKIGKFAPGSGLPIVGFEAFELQKPDYILLLAWNFAEEMMKKTKHLGAKYIVPIPVPEILVDATEQVA